MRLGLIIMCLAAAGWAGAVSAEPVILVCTGTGVATEHVDTDAKFLEDVRVPYRTSFEVTVDFDGRTVEMNGDSMDVRSITDNEIVFARRKPGLMAVLRKNLIYSISRTTGVYRNQEGSGQCERKQTKKLF